MISWIESEIRAMPANEYLVLTAVMVIGFIFLVYYSIVTFRRFRFMSGTATSKIRSAAQGHVELCGLGELMRNDTILSPFSGKRCVWYHCTVDKKKQSGKSTTWTNISDDQSDHLFRLVDDTGECIIDPDYAHVIPESDVTWYGHSSECRSQAPAKSSLISLNMGNYRFREQLIRPATELYALGWFRTVRSDPSVEHVSSQVEELIKQWKLQPQRYLQGFDFDKNGNIQQGEWKAVRAAARKQVLAKMNSEKGEHHILSKPQEKGLPYILSALDEGKLMARKRLHAYASAATAFMLFSTLVVLFSIRALFPI